MPGNLRVDFSSVKPELTNYPWEVMLEQGFHWMDKYGDAHWIDDMDESYLENALRFAMRACQLMSHDWWSFAMRLNGEMAMDSAEREADRFGEYDVPLVKGLRRALARKKGEEFWVNDWELEGDLMHMSLMAPGYDMMDFLDRVGYRSMRTENQ